MGWNPFKRKSDNSITEPVQETRSLDLPDKIFIVQDGNYPEYSESEPAYLSRFNDLISGHHASSNFIQLFHCLPEIFAPVHEIASRVSACNWQLKRASTDSVIYTDRDFNKLFSTPNPLQSFRDFIYQAVCYEILTGKQFFFFNKPSTLPDEYKSIITWSNLPASKVVIKQRKGVDPYTITELNDLIESYSASIDGRTRVFDTKQVLPLITCSLDKPNDLNCAKSQLLGAEKPIKNLIPVYEARGTIYIKRGVMGLLVSKKSDVDGTSSLTKEEKEEVNREVNGRFGLTGGRQTISVTAAPIDFIKTSMSIAEMEPFDETLADAVAIYAVLRVPRHLVPSKDASTFANAASDMKSFYADVIIPMAERYAQAWTNYMKLDDVGKYIFADFSHIPVLQANRKEKADVDKINGEMWERRILNGVACLNEWIMANDGKKVENNPIYELKTGEMSPEQLEQLKNILNLKRNVGNTTDGGNNPGSTEGK